MRCYIISIVTWLRLLTSAAFTQRQVAEVPWQPDTPWPYHQVPASPPQEEETTQYQRTVPGLAPTPTQPVVSCRAQSFPVELQLTPVSWTCLWMSLAVKACHWWLTVGGNIIPYFDFNVHPFIPPCVHNVYEVCYVALSLSHTHTPKRLTSCLGI